jgi:hypothetical protein
VVADEDDEFFPIPAADFVHELLGEKGGAFDMDGVVFLASADVEQDGFAFLDQFGGFGWGELGLAVRFMAGQEVFDDFVHGQPAVAGAHFGQRLGGLETATRAPADMILAEKRALSAGQAFEHFTHGQIGFEGDGRGHAGKVDGSGPPDKRALYPLAVGG